MMQTLVFCNKNVFKPENVVNCNAQIQEGVNRAESVMGHSHRQRRDTLTAGTQGGSCRRGWR